MISDLSQACTFTGIFRQASDTGFFMWYMSFSFRATRRVHTRTFTAVPSQKNCFRHLNCRLREFQDLNLTVGYMDIFEMEKFELSRDDVSSFSYSLTTALSRPSMPLLNQPQTGIITAKKRPSISTISQSAQDDISRNLWHKPILYPNRQTLTILPTQLIQNDTPLLLALHPPILASRSHDQDHLRSWLTDEHLPPGGLRTSESSRPSLLQQPGVEPNASIG